MLYSLLMFHFYLILYIIFSLVLIYIYYSLKNWQFDNLSHLLFKTPLASFITLNVLVAIVSGLMCASVQNNERKLQSTTAITHTNIIDKGLSSPLSNKTTAWITDPTERHGSLEDRKSAMIDLARKKYLEKHPDLSINTPSKSKKVE